MAPPVYTPPRAGVYTHLEKPMTFNPSNYPSDWKAVSFWVRFSRAGGRCECSGQCGMHRPNPATRRCTETHGHPAIFARGRVQLSTAHLCQCQPPCSIPAHLLATCQRCHLRIDRKLHAARRRQTLSATKKHPLTPQSQNPTLPPRPSTCPAHPPGRQRP